MPVHERGDQGAKRAGGAAPAKRAARRSRAPSTALSLLRPEDVLGLQREAGNRAVATHVQRDLDPESLAGVHAREPIPKGGPDIRPALQARYPALLGALTGEQLDRWQKVVDHYTVAWHVDARLRRLWDDFAYYGTVREQHPDYLKERRRLLRAVPSKPDERLSVDVRLLLADDVRQPPEWDVQAETAFRQWAVEQITKQPLALHLRPTPGEALGQHPMPGIVHKTKGFVTAADLRNDYPEEYARRVSDREELAKLREALKETTEVWHELQPMHAERSAVNARRIGFGAIRHVSEALGEGSQAYPSLRIWDQPRQLIEQAWPLLRERRYELVVPLIAMAEQSTAAAATRFSAYENRVMTGAGTAVKWLNRLKTTGTIAAGIASGGLGLTGSALVAGGYTLTQEGLGRAAEMHYGQRTNLGLASLVQAAGVSAVMTYLGGALQARFQVAIKARIDRIPDLAGTKLAQLTASAMAAGTSSVYMTATETALKAVVEGKALPKNASELADLVVDGVVENVALDLGLARVNSRVAKEYEAWRGGARGPAVTVPEATGRGVAHATPEVDVPGTAGTGRGKVPAGRLSDVAVRSLLSEAGGWQRLHAELRGGTGLGATLPLAERQALVARFEAHREGLARNAGTLFDGTVLITETGAGRQVEVHFAGDDAAQHVQDATGYLDAKSPGWARQTDVRLLADPASTTSPMATTGGPGAQGAAQIVEHLSPEARALAAEFVAVYDRYLTMDPYARFDVLLEVANRQLVAAGAPPLVPSHIHNPRPEQYGRQPAREWELQINLHLVSQKRPTPREFAAACDTIAHETRHALQWFRMARLRIARTMPGATYAQVRGAAQWDPVLSRFDPQTVKAAWEAQTGSRAAESFTAGELHHQEAAAFYDSVFGTNRAHREDAYTMLDTSVKELDVALRTLQSIEGLRPPENDPLLVKARERYRKAVAAQSKAHDDYELLIEEIDARTHGQGVAAAVLLDARMLPHLREAARTAYRAFQDADRATLNVSRVGRGTRADARARAFRRYEEAVEALHRLEKRLAATAAAAARAGGHGGSGGTSGGEPR
ncbi:hypothetical protein [Cellulomonas fimi]|uniref:Uncharacterized protein n=1 Tax=Cellulomonas fimi (strain ATCC 484 / DSM 20113 / JCM 1341 / CCUG 24087 / LMG 16345 / NBRC 15513 / NCIMB 8980 / NCTC 7547 / NRS-133) TaxID=590998 RepID=F4GZI6_CELFA|nr:hypothetical protein [Cellulomonas fimi]AEE46030.1 hypothetical protein Celf_1900 [Cellulomonas fimi ATCC 484]NNH06882.1 hypothetical protein [Cellulomonas fimi]VEH31359.1 Uncharacterised protein [Cellulomonas fimi]